MNYTRQRLGTVASTRTSNVDKKTADGERAVQLCNYVDVYKNDQITPALDFMQATASPGQFAAFALRAGDTVITKDSETADDIGIPAYVNEHIDRLVCGYHLAIVRPDLTKSHPRFVYWALTADESAQQWAVLATGVTRVGLRKSDIAKLVIPVPSVLKQAAIADFLDREIAKIDVLIAKQNALIQLLGERRKAVITQAVTRGLDSTVPMGPSYIPWLGDIPMDWNRGNIRRFAQMRTGHTPSRGIAEYWSHTTIPWFTLADVWQLRDGKQQYLAETKSNISQLGLDNSAAELLPAGTVILSRTASVGFSGIMPTPMATSQDFWNWVCGESLSPKYLLFVFRSMQQYLRGLMIGSTHKTIYQTDAATLSIPVPPMRIQLEIVDYLERTTARIDSLISKATRCANLLGERRSALITAALTGKIDVRGAV